MSSSTPIPDEGRWAEQWTLGAATRQGAADATTVALAGPTIYHEQEVEVVSKLEAEQAISNALARQREHLLGDEAVEAAARRQFDLDGGNDERPHTWLGVSESMREEYRVDARATLEAALSEVVG